MHPNLQPGPDVEEQAAELILKPGALARQREGSALRYVPTLVRFGMLGFQSCRQEAGCEYWLLRECSESEAG